MLRDYQTQAIVQIRESLKQHKRVCYVCPTGGGKSVVIGEIIAQAALKSSRVYLVVHRDKLIDQLKKTLESRGISVGIVKSGVKPTDASVQIISILSWRSRTAQLPVPDLILVDEAHRACAKSYLSFFKAYDSAKAVGFTATPCLINGEGLHKAFDSLVIGPSVDWLIERGYLAQFDYKMMTPILTPEELQEIAVRNGDYSVQALTRRIKPEHYQAQALNALVEYGNLRSDSKVFSFAMDIVAADALADYYRSQGVSACALHSEISEPEQFDILETFKNTDDINVIVSVDLFTEGIDVPRLDVVQMLRPTQSLRIYLQQVGRVLRKYGDKKKIILDQVGNWERHGLPDWPRQWDIRGTESKVREIEEKAKKADNKRKEREWEQLGFTPGTRQLLLAIPDEKAAFWQGRLKHLISHCLANGHNPRSVMYHLKSSLIPVPYEVFHAAAQWCHKAAGTRRSWGFYMWCEVNGKRAADGYIELKRKGINPPVDQRRFQTGRGKLQNF